MSHRYSQLPWGKAYRKIPEPIAHKLTQLEGKQFVVACVKELTADDFVEKRYQHLGIGSEADIGPTVVSLLPSSNVGPTSYLNAVTEEKPRKDIGKVLKTIRGSAPNRGGRGRHVTKKTIPVWPTKMLFPMMSHIGFRRIRAEADRLLVQFEVEEILDSAQDDFSQTLLRCLNLLQENAGRVDVFPLDAEEAERARRAYQTIGWEPLAAASPEDRLRSILRRLRSPSAETKKRITDRLAVIERLNPEHMFKGSGHFSSYFAAQFTKDLVVFENLLVGAIYIMRSDWKTLSRLSRSQLLTEGAARVERIVHRSDWEQRLVNVVLDARGQVGM